MRSAAVLRRTDGGLLPLRGVAVTGVVSGGHACITVTQRYQNPEPLPVEALYTFPLPSDATLVGFTMVCNDRRLDGMVQEREAAFRDFCIPHKILKLSSGFSYNNVKC